MERKVGDVVNGWKLEKEHKAAFGSTELERYWGLDGALLIVGQKCSWWDGPPLAQMASDSSNDLIGIDLIGLGSNHVHVFEWLDAVRGGRKCACGANEMDKMVPVTTFLDRTEAPCPACRTLLYDDEPTCWRCGWKRP